MQTMDAALATLVRSGKITESRINESAKRIAIQKFRQGLFENPYVDPAAATATTATMATTETTPTTRATMKTERAQDTARMLLTALVTVISFSRLLRQGPLSPPRRRPSRPL